MKKHNILFVCIMLVISIFAPIKSTFAGDVNKTTAREVGAYFLSAQFGDKALTPETMTLVYTIQNVVRDIPALYVFNTNDKRGCVIIAGTDCMDPIIGYSTEGNFDPNDIPEAMQWWLNQYVDYVVYAQNNNLEPGKKAKESWNVLAEKRLPYFGNQSKAITTLLTTKWDQDDYYNAWSPVVNGQHCYAGCVATALGQLIRYWEYPVSPTGFKSYRWKGSNWLKVDFDTVFYDYSKMPDRLGSSTPADEINETAKLLYTIGVSVEMDFGTNGSGALSTKVPVAMKNYFKYDGESEYLDRTFDNRYANRSGVVNSKDSAWVSRLRDEILARRPVYYDGTDPQGSGRDAAGHAFVCDGYNTNTDKFRFNFGWGSTASGRSANNVWFNVYLGYLDVSSYGGYVFSTGHGMCVGLQPPADSISNPVAIHEVENPFTTTVYPNPASSDVTVNYTLNDGEETMLEVLDINGRIVSSFKVLPSASKISFSVADFRPGLYVCRLKGHTTKFIVK